MKHLLLFLICGTLLLSGCGRGKESSDGEEPATSYQRISQTEAMEMMARDDGHIVLDVRRQDEYDAGHIPGAVLLPNEDIGITPPEALPDFDQIILIYCRSGNRSKQAAQKLFNMGYTHLYEFGGINTWPGEIVTETAPQKSQTASISFDSFDGGGPEFSIQLDDPSIASYERSVNYARDDHAEIDGAGFTVTFTFTGRKAGETRARISARSPIAEDFDEVYAVRVDEALNVTLEALERFSESDAIQPVPQFVIEINDRIFYAALEPNDAAQALTELLSRGMVEVTLLDQSAAAMVGPLPEALPQSDDLISVEPGDLFLLEGETLGVCHAEEVLEATLLARIGNVTEEQMLEVFGDGGATVRLWIEWSE